MFPPRMVPYCSELGNLTLQPSYRINVGYLLSLLLLLWECGSVGNWEDWFPRWRGCHNTVPHQATASQRVCIQVLYRTICVEFIRLSTSFPIDPQPWLSFIVQDQFIVREHTKCSHRSLWKVMTLSVWPTCARNVHTNFLHKIKPPNGLELF